jgi:TDG/mug DNA glycosylase family protein
MDRRTVDVYERSAGAYAAARSVQDTRRPASFAAAVPGGRLRLDLGCGPGMYLGLLGAPIVAADAAAAMLDVAGTQAPHALRIQCDLEALPFRRAAFAGTWASKAHQHIPADRLPMALADLHRILAVGGRLDLTVFEGEGTMVSDDDFPGRFFTGWQAADMVDLLVGAGFDVDRLGTPGDGEVRRIEVTSTRSRTLADTVGPNMKLLCCGLNPSVYAADAGVAFARPGNRFWPALRNAGLTTADRNTVRLLREDAIGMTDLVKRATARADVLTPTEYREGVGRIERLCLRLAPKALCLVGLAGWRVAVDRRAVVGWQPARLGGVPVYVMPSTSGANAHATPDALARHLRMAAAGP